MATALEARIKALEAGKPAVDGRIVLVTGRTPAGQPDRVVSVITCGAQRWQRHDGESVQALRARAATECRRNEAGVALLFELAAPA
jgi:ribosomal protein L14